MGLVARGEFVGSFYDKPAKCAMEGSVGLLIALLCTNVYCFLYK